MEYKKTDRKNRLIKIKKTKMMKLNQKQTMNFLGDILKSFAENNPLITSTILFDINDGSMKFYNPNEKNETEENVVKAQREIINCPNCDGDGYLRCDLCAGNGYTIERKPIGEKNIIITCQRCDGTGDVICPDCNGSGKNKEYDIDVDVNMELINKTIIDLFSKVTHNTIIGPVTIPIADIQHQKSGIYVIPDLKEHTLIFDDEIELELISIQKQFGLEKPIVIPDYFFDS